MPFKSKKQQRYAFATKQPWAEEFAQETKKIKRGKKKGFKALPEQVEKSAFGVVHKRLMPLNPHQTAIKVATKQARAGKIKVSDAQASADWAAKQMQRARVKKSDVSKSTRQERQNRRLGTGVGIGVTTGSAAMGGLYTQNNYSAHKKNLKNRWDYNERLQQSNVERENFLRQTDWRLSGGYKRTKTWVEGSTGEKFESPGQQERVRRLRAVANHSSSYGTPEGENATRKLRKMGFEPKPKQESPGGWQVKHERVPRPEDLKYERKPWVHPGKKNLLRRSMKLRGFKRNLAGSVATGALLGAYGGIIGGVKYHQKREGIKPYQRKR